MNWADDEPWHRKFDHILTTIDAAAAEDKAVGLVGASAGAAAVINAFAARKHAVIGVVLIAGKVNRPQAIGQRYRHDTPAFVRSAYDCQSALASLAADDRCRILSRYGFFDELVSKRDSCIPGARNRRVPTPEHIFTIAIQLIFGAPSFIRFLRRLPPAGNK